MTDVIALLRARVRLQRPIRSEDDLGGAGAEAFSDEGAAWAEIVGGAGGDMGAFDTAPSTTAYRVSIRRRDDVRAQWRVAWGARRLRVMAVRDDGASRIDLLCEEEML